MPSGTFGVSNNSAGLNTEVRWSTGDDAANNRSLVTAELWARRNSATTYGSGSWGMNISGNPFTENSTKSVGTSWVLIMSRQIWHTHAANGTMSGTISVSGGIPGTSWTSTSGSGGYYGTDYYRPPSMYGPPTASSITANSFTVSWPTAGSWVGVSNYELHVCRTPAHDPSGSPWYSWVGSAATSVNVTGAQRNTQYYASVRVQDSEGTSDWTSWTPIMTAATSVPSAPTGYSATDITSSSFYTTLPSVADNGGGALTNVKIEVNTTASPTGATMIQNNRYAPVFVNNLPAGTWYYRMAVKNDVVGGGWSDWGAWVTVPLLTNVPGQVATFGSTATTDTTSQVYWTAPTVLNGATISSYQLRVARDLSFSTGLQTFSLPSTATFKDLTGLLPSTTHYAQIWPGSNNGPGGYSNIILIITAGAPTDGLYVNYGGTVKFNEVYMNDGGTIKRCTPYTNDGGTIKMGVA